MGQGAEVDVDRLKTVYEAAVNAYKAEAHAEALAKLDELKAISPPDTFHLQHYYYFATTILGFRLERHAEALAVVEEGTAAFPAYRELWFLKGRILSRLERPREALRAFRRAQRLKADAATTYEIAKICLLQRRYAAALRIAERGTEAFPSFRELWFIKGRLFVDLGRPAAALRAFIFAQRLRAEGATAYEIARVLHRAGRADLARKMAASAADLGVSPALLERIFVEPPGEVRGAPFSQWLPHDPEAATHRISPRGHCEGALLILGNAYCGSTLLNILLGAHPSIAGGGELHWLVHASAEHRAREGRCVFCGDSCPIWTPAAREEVTPDNLYDLTAKVFARPCVCDASKMVDWSAFMAPASPAPTVRVLLAKHPVRHVASFLEKARRSANPGPFSSLDGVLDHLAKVYARASAERIDVVLRYEDVVTDTRAALTPLLHRLGLAYDVAMENWRSAPHHHIGGNAGPRSQIAPTSRPTGGLLQRKYNRTDVFIDDSFATILSAAEVSRIVQHPKARAIFDSFGYEPEIAPAAETAMATMSIASGRLSLRQTPQPLARPFEPSGGHCYLARMELLPQHRFIHSVADDNDDHARSPLKLLENGSPLGPAHTPGAQVRAGGQGRFSHWKDVLLFSASDNSDPNTNGRSYGLSL